MGKDIKLPRLSPLQLEIVSDPHRFIAVTNGRRWGKTTLALTIACYIMTQGGVVGYFVPLFKHSEEVYMQMIDILSPLILNSSFKGGVIRLKNGGRCDFWVLENQLAGRSRNYDKVIIDEAGFTNQYMIDIWSRSIIWTLIDRKGSALVLGTPAGKDPNSFFYRCCHGDEFPSFKEFKRYKASTYTNPILSKEEVDMMCIGKSEKVVQQEVYGEFVDWTGDAYFNAQDVLINGEGVDMPTHCSFIFATLDTAQKVSDTHDGTAIMIWAFEDICPESGSALTLLEWDILKVEGALLEKMIPKWIEKCQQYARMLGARNGFDALYIEDKSSGTVLLQQANYNNLPVQAINSKTTSIGKEPRALAASPYIFRGELKISKLAFEKKTVYNGLNSNHMMTQVFSYIRGVKQANDDLLDAFCYGVLIAFEGSDGLGQQM